MNHLNQSQRGFGWFLSELQGVWPKELKPHVTLARTGPVRPSLLRRAVPQPDAWKLVSHAQDCNDARIFFSFILQLWPQAWEKRPKVARVQATGNAAGTQTQPAPEIRYQPERGFWVKSLETHSRLLPAGIPWLNLSHPPNKNSMFHQQNASNPIRSIFSK